MESIRCTVGIALRNALHTAVNRSKRNHIGIIITPPYYATDVIRQPGTHLRNVHIGGLLGTDGTFVKILLAIHLISKRCGTIRHFPRAHTQILLDSHGCTLIMVTHHILNILYTKRWLRPYVQRHRSSLGIAHRIGKIGIHILSPPFIEETP